MGRDHDAVAGVHHLRLAADSARFGQPEVKLGIVPAVISPYVIVKVDPPLSVHSLHSYFLRPGDPAAVELLWRDYVLSLNGDNRHVARRLREDGSDGAEAQHGDRGEGSMPGVLGVWTGADLNAAGYGPLKTLIPVPNRDGTPMKTPRMTNSSIP